MWVFGYGSLMWDGWETSHACEYRFAAELQGYRRIFNKASVKRWGTKTSPCPTLNVIESIGQSCWGIAFKFPDEHESDVLTYLRSREGKDFKLRQLSVRMEKIGDVSAWVPIYEGKNIIETKDLVGISAMVTKAMGKSGQCLQYIENIAEKLETLGIEDQAVKELWKVVRDVTSKPKH